MLRRVGGGRGGASGDCAGRGRLHLGDRRFKILERKLPLICGQLLGSLPVERLAQLLHEVIKPPVPLGQGGDLGLQRLTRRALGLKLGAQRCQSGQGWILGRAHASHDTNPGHACGAPACGLSRSAAVGRKGRLGP
jgi:hypothetical protein